jgi:hypothetical protein
MRQKNVPAHGSRHCSSTRNPQLVPQPGARTQVPDWVRFSRLKNTAAPAEASRSKSISEPADLRGRIAEEASPPCRL